jgi:hypothetical protein
MTITIFLQDLLYKVLQGTLESKLVKKKKVWKPSHARRKIH